MCRTVWLPRAKKNVRTFWKIAEIPQDENFEIANRARSFFIYLQRLRSLNFQETSLWPSRILLNALQSHENGDTLSENYSNSCKNRQKSSFWNAEKWSKTFFVSLFLPRQNFPNTTKASLPKFAGTSQTGCDVLRKKYGCFEKLLKLHQMQNFEITNNGWKILTFLCLVDI